MLRSGNRTPSQKIPLLAQQTFTGRRTEAWNEPTTRVNYCDGQQIYRHTEVQVTFIIDSDFSPVSIMSAQTAESEVSFTIAIPDERLSILQQKLALTTLPDELEDARWDYGAPLADIRRLLSHWKEGYDWRKHEAQLNAELPQFRRDIQVEGHGTLNIHYIHKKSEVADAIPLLFVHGCEFGQS